MKTQEYNPLKLKNLFHYVIKAAGARTGFGAVKLYKIAWFSDAKFYLLHGRSITGATYIREKYGPVPREGMRVRTLLANEGAIRQTQGREYEGWHFAALTNPDLSVFDNAELQAINYWIKHIDEDHTAESISDLSHDYGWEIAPERAELPYHAFLASRIRDPSSDELQRIKARAKERGLI